jgi:ATP-binding cassette, subfamily B, bacterial PglK
MVHKNIYLLKRLWRHIGPHRKRQFVLLLILMSLTSLSEVISIGAVLPFLSALIEPGRIFEMPFLQPIIKWMKITRAEEVILPLCIFFGFAILMTCVMRLLLLWCSARLSFGTGAELSGDIYRRTLYQPYAVHCARNSSEIIDGVVIKSNGIIYNAVLPALTLISSGILLLGICTTLLLVDPIITLTAFGGFAFMYLLVIKFTRKRLEVNSISIARSSPRIIKSLQEGLGGIRDILIDNLQEIYSQTYRDADSSLRRSQGDTLFIINTPRYVIEALGMILITMFAYWISLQPDGIKTGIPIIGVFALGAQRLLPVLQQSYASWTQISNGKISLSDTLDLLDQPLPENAINSTVNLIPFKMQLP